MDGPSDELLAGSTLTLHENRGFGVGDLRDHGELFEELGIVPYDAVEAVAPRSAICLFPPERDHFFFLTGPIVDMAQGPWDSVIGSSEERRPRSKEELMGRIVIACYRPKPGKREALRELMADHLPILRSQGLATDRESIAMEAEDGTVVEVFEWKSAEAIEAAHSNPVVGEMWKRYEEACEYVPVGAVKEAGELFATFTPFGG